MKKYKPYKKNQIRVVASKWTFNNEQYLTENQQSIIYDIQKNNYTTLSGHKDTTMSKVLLQQKQNKGVVVHGLPYTISARNASLPGEKEDGKEGFRQGAGRY